MQKFGGPYSLELIDLEGDHFNLKWKTENNFFIFPPLQRGRKSIRIKPRFYKWVEELHRATDGETLIFPPPFIWFPLSPFGRCPLLTGLLPRKKRECCSLLLPWQTFWAPPCSPLLATQNAAQFFFFFVFEM